MSRGRRSHTGSRTAESSGSTADATESGKRSVNEDRGAPESHEGREPRTGGFWSTDSSSSRSEEHTSELQSQSNLVCRLLLEKKKKKKKKPTHKKRHRAT